MLISTKSVIEGKENTEMLSPILDSMKDSIFSLPFYYFERNTDG